tara:strand:+ start:1198 stop:1599 length:402 start_codon:yes stop_codon:yes gene_type:complete
MLKLTRKTEYALIALRHLQQVKKGEIVSAKEIANVYKIPITILSKVLQELSKEEYIQPVQGPLGGYKLKAKLDKISMTVFFETMEGPLGIMDCYYDDSKCELVNTCNIRTPIERLNNRMRDMLNKMSVKDVTC